MSALLLLSVVLAATQCLVTQSSTTLYASYRKDFFYPYDWYPEINLPSPVNGGRFQLVGTAQASGEAKTYFLDGKQVSFNGDVDWMHVYPPKPNQGDPMWITFHTQDKKWDKTSSGSVRIVSDSGSDIVNGTFDVHINWCNITWVATDTKYATLLVHVHNGLTVSRTISKVIYNGMDVTGSVKNKASLVPAPGTSTLLEIPLAAPTAAGKIYTLVLMYQESGSVPSVAAGRITNTFMPIEAWETSTDCPFPTVNDTTYKWHRDHGIDTFYVHEGSLNKCHTQVTLKELIEDLSPKYGFHSILDVGSIMSISVETNVLAVLISDEADDKLNNTYKLMELTKGLWSSRPDLLTYGGGSRSRRNGIFAGTADIQGMDMYIAACAPHIQEFLHYPPTRGSYDYLRLTRNNHLPNPTWLYSQGLSHTWDAKIGSHVIAYRNPDPDEYRIQAMSVITACAKGLMYFQSTYDTYMHYGDTWKEMANFNKDIRAVSRFIFEGDCNDMTTSTDQGQGPWDQVGSMVQSIRSREAILVTVLGLHNHGGYSDIKCEAGENVHWLIWDHTIDVVEVKIPGDFGSVVDQFEVQNGKILNIQGEMVSSVNGTELSSVKFTKVKTVRGLITRLFVLANTKDVRTEIQHNLQSLSEETPEM